MKEDMTEEQMEELVQKNVEIINSFVEKYGADRSDKIAEILSRNENYFIAPASSKEEYHDCHVGGLAKHSVDVFVNLLKLDKVFNTSFNKESMLIVALFHDFGKCKNSKDENFYVPTTESWQKKKGFNYELNHGPVWFTTRDRTVFLLQQEGLILTAEEYQAIILNDGQYIEENKGYKLKECKLATLLHMADRMTLNYENF